MKFRRILWFTVLAAIVYAFLFWLGAFAQQPTPLLVMRSVSTPSGKHLVTRLAGGPAQLVIAEEWDKALVMTLVPYYRILALDYPAWNNHEKVWMVRVVGRGNKPFEQLREGDLFGLPYGLKQPRWIVLRFGTLSDAREVFYFLIERMNVAK